MMPLRGQEEGSHSGCSWKHARWSSQGQGFGKAAWRQGLGHRLFTWTLSFRRCWIYLWKGQEAKRDMSWGPDTRFMECKGTFLILRCCRNHSENKGRLMAPAPWVDLWRMRPQALTSKITLDGIWWSTKDYKISQNCFTWIPSLDSHQPLG